MDYFVTTKLIKYNFSVALDKNNKPYVYDGHSVYTLSSGLWSTYGKSKFSSANAFWNITVDKKANVPYVVFDELDANGYPQVSVMKYSTNSWGYVGSSKFTNSSYGVYYLDIAVDTTGTPMVCMQEDDGFERGSVYKYSSGAWTLLGSPHFTKSHSYFQTLTIDRKNNPLLLYSDFTCNANGTVLGYANKEWTLLGERGFAPSLSFARNAIAADANNNMIVAFVDNTQSNKVSVMKYSGYPLPLNLLSFMATVSSQNTVLLSWQTSNEQNTSNFIIQYSSNGTSFASVASISSKGLGNNEYDYFDTKANAGIVYYRLVSVDKSGKFTYSKVVEVVLNKQGILSLYPNPAKNVLNVSIANSTKEIAVVQVIDLLGKVVKQQTVQLIAGNNNVSIAIENLAKGSYSIKVNGQSTQQKQFIKL